MDKALTDFFKKVVPANQPKNENHSYMYRLQGTAKNTLRHIIMAWFDEKFHVDTSKIPPPPQFQLYDSSPSVKLLQSFVKPTEQPPEESKSSWSPESEKKHYYQFKDQFNFMVHSTLDKILVKDINNVNLGFSKKPAFVPQKAEAVNSSNESSVNRFFNSKGPERMISQVEAFWSNEATIPKIPDYQQTLDNMDSILKSISDIHKRWNEYKSNVMQIASQVIQFCDSYMSLRSLASNELMESLKRNVSEIFNTIDLEKMCRSMVNDMASIQYYSLMLMRIKEHVSDVEKIVKMFDLESLNMGIDTSVHPKPGPMPADQTASYFPYPKHDNKSITEEDLKRLIEDARKLMG